MTSFSNSVVAIAILAVAAVLALGLVNLFARAPAIRRRR